MDDYGAATYGDRIAEVYDTLYGELPSGGNIADTVERLRELGRDRPLLELGIGTGRVALPLLESGAEVHGIDASEQMVSRLRGKPGGDRIPVTIGDFGDFALETRFGVVYVVFNTFFALLSQDEQVGCFQAVASHLLPDGVFVMEAFVPDVTRFMRGQNVSAVGVEPDEFALEISTHDPVLQRTDSQRVMIRDGGIRLFPVKIRYAYVSELDLMARLAGMRLRERWAEWDRTPFGGDAGKHISVWELDR